MKCIRRSTDDDFPCLRMLVCFAFFPSLHFNSNLLFKKFETWKLVSLLKVVVLIHITDSQSFARLQEALRDSKRQVDKQRERIVALETSRKQMESDLAEVQE